MKPYQLLAALMHKEGIRPLPLARSLRKENLQPQIQRFVRGNVPSPAHSTAAPLATYFGIPLEAMYDERAATAVAKERGLTVVDWPPVAAKRAEAAAKETAPMVDAALRQFERLTPAQRNAFLRLAGAQLVSPRTGAPEGGQEVPHQAAENQSSSASMPKPPLRNVNPPNQEWGAGPAAPTLRDPPVHGRPRTIKRPTKP